MANCHLEKDVKPWVRVTLGGLAALSATIIAVFAWPVSLIVIVAWTACDAWLTHREHTKQKRDQREAELQVEYAREKSKMDLLFSSKAALTMAAWVGEFVASADRKLLLALHTTQVSTLGSVGQERFDAVVAKGQRGWPLRDELPEIAAFPTFEQHAQLIPGAGSILNRWHENGLVVYVATGDGARPVLTWTHWELIQWWLYGVGRNGERNAHVFKTLGPANIEIGPKLDAPQS